MGKLLRAFANWGTTALFAGVLIGLALPGAAQVARPLLAPVVGCLLFFSLLIVDWQAVTEHLRSPLVLTTSMLWLLVISPLGTALVFAFTTKTMAIPPPLESAVILMTCAPPILGATAIAVLLRLDAALTLVLSIAATLIAPLTIAPLALALLGIDIDIGTGPLMMRLGALVGLPFLLALLVRRLVGVHALAARSLEINGVLVILMLLFAVAIMAEGAEVLRLDTTHFIDWTLAGFAANIALQALTAVLFCWRGWRFALTLGLLTGNTNMGLLMATLPRDTHNDILLYFALAQLPMYMLPALQKHLYRRLLARPKKLV